MMDFRIPITNNRAIAVELALLIIFQEQEEPRGNVEMQSQFYEMPENNKLTM